MPEKSKMSIEYDGTSVTQRVTMPDGFEIIEKKKKAAAFLGNAGKTLEVNYENVGTPKKKPSPERRTRIISLEDDTSGEE